MGCLELKPFKQWRKEKMEEVGYHFSFERWDKLDSISYLGKIMAFAEYSRNKLAKATGIRQFELFSYLDGNEEILDDEEILRIWQEIDRVKSEKGLTDLDFNF